jgi:hypothetical protein
VLEAPVEGLDAAIVVSGPAAVLVAADSAFEPVHGKSRQFTVYSQELAKKKGGGLKEGKRRISTQSSQSSAENQGEESVRDEARGVAWFIEGVQ